MAARSREYVILRGLDVQDVQLYDQYRKAMEPLLRSEGGRFGFDFVVGEMLRSEVAAPINRVFTIVFPNVESMRRFFARPDYLEVRAAYFEKAVGSVTALAAFERDALEP